MPLFFFSLPFLLFAAYKVNAMAESGIAILDHQEIVEMEVMCWETRSNEHEFLKTSSHQLTVPTRTTHSSLVTYS